MMGSLLISFLSLVFIKGLMVWKGEFHDPVTLLKR